MVDDGGHRKLEYWSVGAAVEAALIGDRNVLVLYDERMLSHQPEVPDPYLPGRLERRFREILEGLDD